MLQDDEVESVVVAVTKEEVFLFLNLMMPLNQTIHSSKEENLLTLRR